MEYRWREGGFRVGICWLYLRVVSSLMGELTASGWGRDWGLSGSVLGAVAPNPLHGGVPQPWCWCPFYAPRITVVAHAEAQLGDTGWSTDWVECFPYVGSA